jgi:hypothetical protein
MRNQDDGPLHQAGAAVIKVRVTLASLLLLSRDVV